MTLYTESDADQTEYFLDAFVCENFAYGYDVVATFWHLKVYTRSHFV